MEEEDKAPKVLTNIYGDVCLRKSRRKRQKRLITNMFFDYANNTTLHGIPYITRRGVTIVEKIFWSITFLISTFWCFYLIYGVWSRWRMSPVIVTISEHVVPVDMVPFPSVMICPQAKCKLSKYNYTQEYIFLEEYYYSHDLYINSSSLYNGRFEKFNAVSEICSPYLKFSLNDNRSNSTLVDYILEVSPDYEDVFFRCQWKGRTVMCEQLFQKVLTEEGVCFVTNTMAYTEIFKINNVQREFQYLYTSEKSKGWTIEHGYNSSDPNPYPAHGNENQIEPPLVVTLQENKTDRDSLCNALNSGFKLFIHHPSDLPQSSLHYYAVLNNQVSSVALSFGILNTSASLESYPSETLQCHFPEKRHLRYFNIYTAKNCWIECLSNYTFEKCECVDFYLPHNDSEQICSGMCNVNAQRELENDKSYFTKCDCLPACVAVDYEAEILKTEFNVKVALKAWDRVDKTNFSSDYDDTNLSELEVYYKQPRFLSMRRSELFGVNEFLANCGGLLGLFLGFSFLSLVEVFYFLTLRLWCTLKKDLEEEKLQMNKKKEIKIV